MCDVWFDGKVTTAVAVDKNGVAFTYTVDVLLRLSEAREVLDATPTSTPAAGRGK